MCDPVAVVRFNAGRRAAEEDIIQCLIILSGLGESCICGAVGMEGDQGQTSGVTLGTNEWTMVIHQSSMSACLTA